MDGQARWTTAVSDASAAGILIRGYPVEELIGRIDFAEATFLLLRGRLPEPRERAMFGSLLCAILDYPRSPAVEAARVVASASGQLVPAAAAGLLCIGSRIASPQESGELLREAFARRDREGLSPEALAERLVADARRTRRRLPGLGHPSGRDPRAERLRELARAHGFDGEAAALYDRLRSELASQGGPDLPVNVDGMMAAVLHAMGFAPREMGAVAVVSFLPGILAQALEELDGSRGPRLIPDGLFQYTGAARRRLEGR